MAEKRFKHWKFFAIDKDGIILRSENTDGSVISISKMTNGNVRFMEETPGVFGVFSMELSQEDAIEAIEEAIEYLKDEI